MLVNEGVPFPAVGAAEEEEIFEVDLSETEGQELLPEGIYEAVCQGVRQGYSKSSGNLQWVWRFAVASGTYVGYELPYFTSLTPSALWKVAEVVSALGLGEPGKKVSFRRDQAPGRKCLIDVFVDEWQGQKRSSIRQVLPPR